MKKSILGTAAVFCGIFLSGCCSEECSKEVAPAPVAPPVKKVTTARVQNISFSVGDEVKTKLRLQIRHSAGNEDFSERLVQMIGDDLLKEVEIGKFSESDGVIRLGNEFKVVDKTGEYVRVICKRISVSVVCYDQLKSSKTIRLKGMPRKLGYDNAVEQYLDPAARELRKYLVPKIAALNNELLGVSQITMQIRNFKRGDNQIFSREVEKIVRTLGTVNGVLKCQNIAQDIAAGTCTLRIVYSKRNFPQGVRNALNNKLK